MASGKNAVEVGLRDDDTFKGELLEVGELYIAAGHGGETDLVAVARDAEDAEGGREPEDGRRHL